jgi:hypothetical protein
VPSAIIRSTAIERVVAVFPFVILSHCHPERSAGGA